MMLALWMVLLAVSGIGAVASTAAFALALAGKLQRLVGGAWLPAPVAEAADRYGTPLVLVLAAMLLAITLPGSLPGQP